MNFLTSDFLLPSFMCIFLGILKSKSRVLWTEFYKTSKVDKKLEVKILKAEFYEKSRVDKELEIRVLRAEFYEKSRVDKKLTIRILWKEQSRQKIKNQNSMKRAE